MGRVRITKQTTPSNPPADTGEIFIDSADDLVKSIDESGTVSTLGGGGVVPTTRTITAGIGLAGGGDLSANRTIDLDVNDITTLVGSTDTAADFMPLYDASGSVTRKALIQDLGLALAARTITAGVGLSGGGSLSADRTIDLDVNDITTLVGSTDPAADFVPLYDASGAVTRKVLINNIGADHGSLTDLTADDHTQYVLLAGRSGGQTETGGTASGNNLTLRSTSNASKGAVVLDETTASTSPTTGSMQLAGGLGVAGSLGLGGSVYLGSGNISSTTSNHTVAAGERIFLVDTTGGAFNLTLPNPSLRQVVIVKDIAGILQTNPLTVVRFASESIDGTAADKILRTAYGCWTFISNGTNWFVL